MRSSLFVRAIAPLVLAFGLLPLKAAQAAPNGYTLIPIAKVFGNGVASFSYAQSQLGTFSAFYTTQYGLLNRFEIGSDWQSAPADQQAVLGNCKYLLFHQPGHLPDIACGLENIASRQEAVPYLVATTQPGMLGFSLGATQPSGPGGGRGGIGFLHTSGVVGMAGVAYNVTPTVQLVADTIGGPTGYHSLGFIAAATSTISVNLAVTDPNSRRGGPQGFVLNLAYTFHALYRHGSGSKEPDNKNPSAGAAAAGNVH